MLQVYVFTHHVGDGWIEVIAESLEDAEAKAVDEGASFETCENCQESEWMYVATLPYREA